MSRGILVKEIAMGDCEDPYLYAAFPIAEWERTEESEYVKSHSTQQLVFYCDRCPKTWGFVIRIYAELEGEALTYYRLKYCNHVFQHI
jgi:hypothetical protein